MLNDISLDIPSGQMVALLGPSGSGKTTLLRIIAGLEQPDRGRILLDGVVLFDSDAGICLPPQKRQVGYLFQSCALFPHMTVKQNILCGMQKEKDRSRRQESLCRLSRLLRLESVMDLKPGSLSGGRPRERYRQDSGQPPQASPAGRALCCSGFLSEGTAAGRIKGASPLLGVPDRAGDPQP